VADEAAELHVASVCVRVEMDHRDATPTFRPRDACHVRPRDGVVAAKDQRNGAGLGNALHGTLERIESGLALDACHLDIAGVDHAKFLQRVDAKREMRPRRVMGQVVGGADHLRSESGARAVRRACVIRRADDHNVGAFVRRAVVEVAVGDLAPLVDDAAQLTQFFLGFEAAHQLRQEDRRVCHDHEIRFSQFVKIRRPIAQQQVVESDVDNFSARWKQWRGSAVAPFLRSLGSRAFEIRNV